jgi:5-formyltetrahydrofolate cyclo-ligase
MEHVADKFSQKTFGLKPTTCEQRLKVVLTIFRTTSARTKQETLLAWQTLDDRQKYYLAIHPYCSIKMSSNTFSKAAIRKKIRLRLKQLNRLEIAEASLDILSQLKFPDGSKVAIFAGLSCEPQLLEVIVSQPNVKWHLPKVSGPGKMDFLRFEKIEELSLGAFKILEPDHGVKATHLDFMICPGVAFTHEGHRLGQGGGFYDRAIPRFPKTKIIGVGFECQVVDQLPIDKHDCPMDQIIIASMGT